MEQKLSKIRFREDTAINWMLTNPVLNSSEPGFENDTGRLKIGDGINVWKNLPYINSAGEYIADVPSGGGIYGRTKQSVTQPGSWVDISTYDRRTLGSLLSRPNGAEYDLRYTIMDMYDRPDKLYGIRFTLDITIEAGVEYSAVLMDNVTDIYQYGGTMLVDKTKYILPTSSDRDYAYLVVEGNRVLLKTKASVDRTESKLFIWFMYTKQND